MLTIQNLIDDAKCYEQVRQMRWPEGVRCPHCESERVTKRGFHTNQPHRQRYQCHGCDTEFDDLTLTAKSVDHLPVFYGSQFVQCPNRQRAGSQ